LFETPFFQNELLGVIVNTYKPFHVGIVRHPKVYLVDVSSVFSELQFLDAVLFLGNDLLKMSPEHGFEL
jgi:hypothetical protein